MQVWIDIFLPFCVPEVNEFSTLRGTDCFWKQICLQQELAWGEKKSKYSFLLRTCVVSFLVFSVPIASLPNSGLYKSLGYILLKAEIFLNVFTNKDKMSV